MNNEKHDDLFIDYPDVVEVRDLQKMLQIGRNTALVLLSKGTIQCFKIGNRYKIPKTSVADYILSQLAADKGKKR